MSRITRPYRLELMRPAGKATGRGGARQEAASPPPGAPKAEAGAALSAGHLAAAAAVAEAGAGLGRAADELSAVNSDVGRGVHAILGICEELDAAVHRLRADGALSPEGADQLMDRLVLVFQACDFQDLAGQRIANVRGLLTELDRRITTWRFGAGAAIPTPVPGGRAIPGWGGAAHATELENGPRLQSDEGHLTQADVDRLLA